MKKVMMFAMAALLVTGTAFAGGKKCAKGKDCCKKEAKAKAKKADATASSTPAPAKSTTPKG